MKKIAIFGSSGSGKSTLAKLIGDRLNITPIFLDEHLLDKDWSVDANTWKEKIDALLNTNSWITEGNYLRAMETRVRQADVIIVLEISLLVCLFRIVLRHFQYRNQVRPYVNKECVERSNLKFIKYLKSVIDYNKKVKPVIFKRIEAFEGKNKVVILKNKKEIHQFINNLVP